jgi:hypothetical protein
MESTELSQQERANLLWKELENVVGYYNSIACPCAFPRFRQYVGIDCIDYRGSFYFSETEGLIAVTAEQYTPDPANGMQVICRTCGSVYYKEWQDFSIHISRTTMKIVELKAEQVGADPITPIPFNYGPVGHKNPEKRLFQYMELDAFVNYLKELQTIL